MILLKPVMESFLFFFFLKHNKNKNKKQFGVCRKKKKLVASKNNETWELFSGVKQNANKVIWQTRALFFFFFPFTNENVTLLKYV